MGVVLFYKHFETLNDANSYKGQLERLTTKSLLSLIKQVNPEINNLRESLEQNNT